METRAQTPAEMETRTQTPAATETGAQTPVDGNQKPPSVGDQNSSESDNAIYQYIEGLEKESESKMLSTAIWIMAALCFAGLQFYAILLGGVFNIERLTKSHFVLETVALTIGYVIAACHTLFHVFRGLFFRICEKPLWAFWLDRRNSAASARRSAV